MATADQDDRRKLILNAGMIPRSSAAGTSRSPCLWGAAPLAAACLASNAFVSAPTADSRAAE
jgi:hypothetical protein